MAMELKTVSVKGKSLDVYFEYQNYQVNLKSIEDVTGTTDFLPLLNQQTIDLVIIKIKDLKMMEKMHEIDSRFTPAQINAGYVSEAIKNNERGWAND